MFDIFYSSQLIKMSMQKYSSHSKSFCPFQYIASYNTANHPPPTNHYKIIIRPSMDKYRHFKNYTLYRYDSSHYYCKWLPTAVYYGYNPGDVNEKIICILFFKPKYDIENTICDRACDNRACGHMIFAYFFTLSLLITFCTIMLWDSNFQLLVGI